MGFYYFYQLWILGYVQNYGDPTLERFLIARSMDPNKAAKMFVTWKKWRDSFVPLGFIPDSEVLDELKPRKIFLQGFSKSGHPVMIVNASKHYRSKDQQQFKSNFFLFSFISNQIYTLIFLFLLLVFGSFVLSNGQFSGLCFVYYYKCVNYFSL